MTDQLNNLPHRPIVDTIINMYADELRVNWCFLMACELVGYPQAKKEFDREGLNDDDQVNDKVNRAKDLVQSLVDDEMEDCHCSPAARYGAEVPGMSTEVCVNCKKELREIQGDEIPF